MRKVRMVILCASAMSSGLIVEELKRIAPENDIDIQVECFASLRYRYFDYSKVDIVLLAPQVKSQLNDINKYLVEKGHTDVPIMVIPMRDYGLVKGKSILNQALKALDDSKIRQ